MFTLLQYSGGFGVIELVVDTHTQQKEMILKRCNVDRPEVFEIVKKEVNILQKFKGSYIVSLIDNDVAMRNSSREAYILLEYCPGGHLLHRLNERHGQPLPAESIYRIFGQILLGMKSLHEHRPPIIHRDIKLENILFGNVSYLSSPALWSTWPSCLNVHYLHVPV